MKKVRNTQSQKPRWLKSIRQSFPRQIEKPYSTEKGRNGYTREENRRVLLQDIEDMYDV